MHSENISKKCRICLERIISNHNFVSPCNCKGSLNWVHKSCLYKWRISNNYKHFFDCDICKTSYKLYFDLIIIAIYLNLINTFTYHLCKKLLKIHINMLSIFLIVYCINSFSDNIIPSHFIYFDNKYLNCYFQSQLICIIIFYFLIHKFCLLVISQSLLSMLFKFLQLLYFILSIFIHTTKIINLFNKNKYTYLRNILDNYDN